jgi:heat shock protein HtpX
MWLFTSLLSHEKLALLGHEVGHLVNGDLVRGFYVGTALETLATWYHILHHDERSLAEGISVFEYMTAYMMMGLSQLPKWMFYLLLYLVFHEKQRSEYYADYVSAKVAGSKQVLSLMERVHYDHIFFFSPQQSVVKKLPLFSIFLKN